MRLPPSDHPIWKVLQGLISLAGISILVFHGVDGGHTSGPDAEDAAGVGGLALASRMAWVFFKKG